MTRQSARNLARILVLALGFMGSCLADEDSTYGDWISSGSEEFSQGQLERLELDDSNQTLLLGRSGPGIHYPQGEFLSVFHPSNRPFDTVTVGYAVDQSEDSEVRVQVRALGGVGGDKTRWYDVEPESDLLFEGPYRFLQYRVSLQTSDPESSPRFRFFNALFGRRNQNLSHLRPLGTGNGNVPIPEIISRDSWGAKPPKGPYTRHNPEYLVIHHTSLPDIAGYQGAGTLRGIQRYHQVNRGWNDIGYHFVIGPEGAIYQGRPENVVGAHAQPNTGKVGISLVGNYETPNGDELTPETRKSLIKLLAWLAGSYSIDPGSHITGHKDWMSTDCPGQRVYEQLNQLRLDVAKYIADSEHGVPVVPEPPMPQDPSAPLNPVEMYPSEVGNGAQH